jgi:hypothetical protein
MIQMCKGPKEDRTQRVNKKMPGEGENKLWKEGDLIPGVFKGGSI